MTLTTVTRHVDKPRRKSTLHVKQQWGKGDKFRYITWHCGGPNMFGGYYFSKANLRQGTSDKILDSIKSEVYDVTFQDHYTLEKFESLTQTKLTDIKVEAR